MNVSMQHTYTTCCYTTACAWNSIIIPPFCMSKTRIDRALLYALHAHTHTHTHVHRHMFMLQAGGGNWQARTFERPFFLRRFTNKIDPSFLPPARRPRPFIQDMIYVPGIYSPIVLLVQADKMHADCTYSVYTSLYACAVQYRCKTLQVHFLRP